MLLAEISGTEVLDFAEYLENESGIPKKFIPMFQEMGDKLFKKGWTFKGRFRTFTLENPPIDEIDKILILLPEPSWLKSKMGLVRVKFYHDGMIYSDAASVSEINLDVDAVLRKILQDMRY
jgi:hypothetical protein